MTDIDTSTTTVGDEVDTEAVANNRDEDSEKLQVLRQIRNNFDKAHSIMQTIRYKTSYFRQNATAASERVKTASNPLKEACENYFKPQQTPQHGTQIEIHPQQEKKDDRISDEQRRQIQYYLRAKDTDVLTDIESLPYTLEGSDAKALAAALVQLAEHRVSQNDLEQAARLFERAFHNDPSNGSLLSILETRMSISPTCECVSTPNIVQALSRSSRERRSKAPTDVTNKKTAVELRYQTEKRKAENQETPGLSKSRKSLGSSGVQSGAVSSNAPKGPRRVPKKQK
eukprot:gb/GECG01002110.1/.p1 GENE.gb/GECG01002110.1/~~gb/GECG01002110.1/.p1  ORF type:complete len:285 (+),score=44.30 gb/GECG01002110.1/:1-855(+)